MFPSVKWQTKQFDCMHTQTHTHTKLYTNVILFTLCSLLVTWSLLVWGLWNLAGSLQRKTAQARWVIKKVIRTENKSKVTRSIITQTPAKTRLGSYTSLLMSEDLLRKASDVETKRSAVNISLVRNWGMLVERGAPGKQHTHTDLHFWRSKI